MPREFAFGSAYTSSFGEPTFAKNVTLSNATNATTDSISYFTVPDPEFAPLMRSRSKSLPILRGTQTDNYEADTPINKVYLHSNFKPILKPIPAPVQLLPKKTPNVFYASSVADKKLPKSANIELVTPSSKTVAPAASHLPLDQYKINADPNPIVVRKKPAEKVQYTQQISVKFLKPPPLQQPGDIIIRQEPDVQAPPGFLFFWNKMENFFFNLNFILSFATFTSPKTTTTSDTIYINRSRKTASSTTSIPTKAHRYTRQSDSTTASKSYC